MSCRKEEGCDPKCALASLVVERTVEMRGMALSDVIKYQDGEAPTYLKSPRPGAFRVIIVMHAPNIDSDLAGKPFQGETGEFIARFVLKAGLDPEDVWCTYITKCPTPKNRAANKKEYAACTPYLDAEIDLIEPEVVVLMGTKTLKSFKLQNKGGINAIHGKVWDATLASDSEGPSYKVIATYDPGMFLLEDNELKERLAIGDFMAVRRLLNGEDSLEQYVAPYTLVDTLDKVEAMAEALNRADWFCFDTESTSLNMRRSPILCLSFSVSGLNYVLPLVNHDPEGAPWKFTMAWTPEDLATLWMMLKVPFENPFVDKVAHNIKYDILVVRWWSKVHSVEEIITAGTLHDTIVLHHLLDENPPHGLEFLADMYLGFGNYSEGVTAITGKGKNLIATYDHVPDDILWPYNAMDSEACARLFLILIKELLQKPHLQALYQDECCPLTYPLIQAEWYGHKLDIDKLAELRDRYEKEQTKLLASIRGETTPEFNPNSTDQVAEVVNAMGFGAYIVDKDKSKGVSTDKAHLTELAEQHDLFADILKYRTVQKMISTYIVNAEKDIDTDGRIRYGFKQHGAATGRLSCKFFHQIVKIEHDRVKKGEATMRDMFVAEEGYKYVYGDFSQLELRILAAHTGDKEMLRIFKDPDADIHLATAAEILGIPEEGEGYVISGGISYTVKASDNRGPIGKKVNFGLAYGSEGYALLKTGYWVDTDGGEHALTRVLLDNGMNRWRDRFKEVGDHLLNTGDSVRANKGICYTSFGRERRFGKRIFSKREGVRKAAEREAVNHPIQGGAGSLLNRTLIIIHEKLEEWILAGDLSRGDVRLVNTVHDSAAFEVKAELVDWFKGVFRLVAERQIAELSNTSFKVDIGVGSSWTEAEMAA